MNAMDHGFSAMAQEERLGSPVELKNLQLTYGGGVRAVDDVSLSVRAGEFVSLLGPSGSGKTTTLKMLAGFEEPDSGEITVGGRSILGVSAAKRNIGMVFQNYALFPHMSVFDNVAFPLRMRKRPKNEIRQAVHAVLSLVHMQDHAGRKPGQLSGGQQQRVAFARAIVFKPPLLLMDEPLGALDRQLRKDVQYELKRVQKRLGLTVIYVTHDQDEALFLSDTIAVMENGRIAQAGAPPALYESPRTRFVAEFLGESNFISGHLDAVAEGRAIVTLADGLRITGRPIDLSGREGTPVEILIRPEKLDFADAQSHENRIPGRIEMVNFLGSQLEYEVQTAGGMLAARSYLRSGSAPLSAGTVVDLGFSADDCMVFPAANRS
jgi:putative spermidine/putrescine transport system ATP-binding protein